MYNTARKKFLDSSLSTGKVEIKAFDRHGRSWLMTEITSKALKSMKPRTGRPLLYAIDGGRLAVYPTPDEYYEYQPRTATT